MYLDGVIYCAPGKDQTPFTGALCGLAWKGMETWMQISIRNKYLVSRDWVKCKVSWPWRHCCIPQFAMHLT